MTAHSSHEVAEIAGRLTKAQRDAVLNAQPWLRGSDQSGPWHARKQTIDALHRADVCNANGLFSPLGEAVRAYLMEQPK